MNDKPESFQILHLALEFRYGGVLLHFPEDDYSSVLKSVSLLLSQFLGFTIQSIAPLVFNLFR